MRNERLVSNGPIDSDVEASQSEITIMPTLMSAADSVIHTSTIEINLIVVSYYQ